MSWPVSVAIAALLALVAVSVRADSYPSGLRDCSGEPFSSMDSVFTSKGIDVDKSSCQNSRGRKVVCQAQCSEGYTVTEGRTVDNAVAVRCVRDKGDRVWRIRRRDSLECLPDTAKWDHCGSMQLVDYAMSINLDVSGCSRRNFKSPVKCSQLACVDGFELQSEMNNGRVNGKVPKFRCARAADDTLEWRLWPRVECVSPALVYEPLDLDCSDPASREAVSLADPDIIDSITSCCCAEADPLQGVQQNIGVASFTTDVSFANLAFVGGSITGRDGSATTLSLGVLTHVGGDIDFYDNDITSVSFGSLKSVDGTLNLDNNVLTDIDFAGLTYIGADLFLDGNDLSSVDLAQLAYVGGSLNLIGAYPTRSPTPRDNFNQLISVDFGALTYVGAGINIDAHYSLTSLDFGLIQFIGGDIYAPNNFQLSSINFGPVTFVGGDLLFGYNALTSLDLGNIASVGSLDFIDNELTFVSFGSVTSVGNLDFRYNSLTAVDFGSVITVSGDMLFDYNSLTSLNLAGVNSVGGDLSFGFNVISSVDFGSLTSVGGTLFLSVNQLAILAFGNIASIGGDLDLGDNQLTSIDFGTVTSVGGVLVLSYNQLTTIDLSATSLTNIGSSIDVRNNPGLTYLNCNNLGTGVISNQGASLTLDNCPP